MMQVSLSTYEGRGEIRGESGKSFSAPVITLECQQALKVMQQLHVVTRINILSYSIHLEVWRGFNFTFSTRGTSMNLIQAPEYLISKKIEDISLAHHWNFEEKCDKTVIIHLKLKYVFKRDQCESSKWNSSPAGHNHGCSPGESSPGRLGSE